MPLALNNNRGSVYSGQMKIEVPERYSTVLLNSNHVAVLRQWKLISPSESKFFFHANILR